MKSLEQQLNEKVAEINRIQRENAELRAGKKKGTVGPLSESDSLKESWKLLGMSDKEAEFAASRR